MRRITTPTRLVKSDVEVRLISLNDASRLQHLLATNRDWLTQWEATLPGVTLKPPGSYSLKWAIKNLLKGHRAGTEVPFVMLYRGMVVGQLSVSNIVWGAACSGAIGYWVAKEYAGLGITPTAVALVIDHMLTEAGLHRIEICIRPQNAASKRVVEKLGLRFEGRRLQFLHINGDWADHDCYAIVAEELGAGTLHRLRAGGD